MQPSNPMNVSYQQQMATGIPVGSMAGNHHQKPGLHLAWSSGLCDCFSDVPSCCLTFWCPCITFGRIAEIVDQGSTSCGTSGALYGLISLLTGCCGCIYSCVYRTKMRRAYNIEEHPCGDCCVHFCCEACALCQEYRHLQTQGFDMPLGWHGNMAMQNRGVEMAAPTAPPMMGRGMK